MKKLSVYPKYIDKFIRKIDEMGDGDGDYVMADDVNALQDSIVAIQQSLGINPQGSFSDITGRLNNVASTGSFGPARLTFFDGEVDKVNGSKNCTEAARYFASYPTVIFRENIMTVNERHTLSLLIETTKALSNTDFYIEINGSLFLSNSTSEIDFINEVMLKTESIESLGIDGIYLSNFGYDQNTKRDVQSSIVENVKNKGFKIMVSANNPADILNDDNEGAMNENNQPTFMSSGDIFLYRDFLYKDGELKSLSALKPEMNTLLSYRISKGIKLYAHTEVKASNLEKYNYAYGFAMLYSLDSFYASNSELITTIEKPYPQIPISGSTFDLDPQITYAENNIVRQTSMGKLNIDTLNSKYYLEDVLIPVKYIDFNDGDGVDASVLKGELNHGVAINIVARINASSEGLQIKPEMINYTDAGGQMIHGINVTTLNENNVKIKREAVEAVSTADLIGIVNSAVSSALEAELKELLESGTYSASFQKLTSNFIAAMNAYIENAIIDHGEITWLDAGVIRSGYIMPDIINVNTITSDKLTIHANGGANKWSGTIVAKETLSKEPNLKPSLILGKDILKRVEFAESKENYIISTTEYMPKTTKYYVLWETYVFCDRNYETIETLEFKSTSSASLIINGVFVVSSDNNIGDNYDLELLNGWNKIQIVQEHIDELEVSFDLGVKLSQQALETEKGNPTGIVRIDAYADNFTQIEGDYIKTGTIEVVHLNADVLKANNIKTGKLHADTKITIGSDILLDGSEGIILSGGKGIFVEGQKAINVSEGTIVATETVGGVKTPRVSFGNYETDPIDGPRYGIEVITGNPVDGNSITLDKRGLRTSSNNFSINADGTIDLVGRITATEGHFNGKIGVGVIAGGNINDAKILIDGSSPTDPQIKISVNSSIVDYIDGNNESKTIQVAGGYVRISKEGIQVSRDNRTWVTKLHADGLTVGTTDIGDGVITTRKINTDELNAGLINAGLITAMEAYIQDLTATSGDFESLLADLIVAKSIDATNISVYSEAFDRSGRGGFLFIDSGGMLVSSKPKNIFITEAEELVFDITGSTSNKYIYRASKQDWVINKEEPFIISLVRKSDNRPITPISKWYSTDPKLGIVFVRSDVLLSEGIYISECKVTASYKTYIGIPGDAHLVKIDSAGISVSPDGGKNWNEKLNGAGLNVTSAEISSLKAGKIESDKLNAATSIDVAGKVIIDGINGIVVNSTSGAGITVREKISESSSVDRILIGQNAGSYGMKLITNDAVITLDKKGLSTSTNKFSINANGTISAIDGNFSGTIKTTNAVFGNAENHVSVDFEGITLGTGSIVDTRDETKQALKLDSEGIVAKQGIIGGLNIIPELDFQGRIIDSVIKGQKDIYDELGEIQSTIDQFIFNPETIELTGEESLTINSGTLVVKENGKVYLGVGKIDRDNSKYGLRVDMHDPITGEATGKYIQLDQDGMRAFNGAIDTINIDKDGNIKVVGEIEANSGKLGMLLVEGVITIGETGSIKAGNTVLSSDGIRGTGFVLSETQNTIAGWNINEEEIHSPNIQLNSALETINIAGENVVLGKYGEGLDEYGIKANKGLIAGWDISEDTISKEGLIIDSNKESIETSGAIIGQYENGKFGIKATSGLIGKWDIEEGRLRSGSVSLDGTNKVISIANEEELEVVLGEYDTNKFGLQAGTVTLDKTGLNGFGFSLNEEGISSVSGKIGAWDINSSGLHSTNIHLDSAKGKIWIGESESNPKVLFKNDGSGNIGNMQINTNSHSLYSEAFQLTNSGQLTLRGTVQATAGWFGNSNNPGVTITQDGLRAGFVQLTNQGLYISDSTSVIEIAGLFKVNSTGMTVTAGKIANWNISNNKLTAGSIELDATKDNEKISIGTNVIFNADGSGKLGKILIGPNGSLTSDNFSILDDGTATFNGHITAELGSNIAGWETDATSIKKDNIRIDSALEAILIGNSNATETLTLENANAIFGRYEEDKYGLVVKDGIVGNWVVGEDFVKAGDIILDASSNNQMISFGEGKIELRSEGSAKIGRLNIGADGSLESPGFSIINKGTEIAPAWRGVFDGTLESKSGNIGGWIISDTLYKGNVTIDGFNEVIKLSNEVLLGQYAAGVYGIKAGLTTMNGSGLHANQGDIGGWKINASSISKKDGVMETSIGNGEFKIVNGATPMIYLKKDGSAILGKLSIDSLGALSSNQFAIESSGNATFSGELKAASGSFSGKVTASSGNIAGWEIDQSGKTLSNSNIILSSLGVITIGSGSKTIVLSSTTGMNINQGQITADLNGKFIAQDAEITGTIKSKVGYFGTQLDGVNIDPTGLEVKGTGSIRTANTTMGSKSITIKDGLDVALTLGEYETEKIGLKGNGFVLNKLGLNLSGLAGINIDNKFIVSKEGNVTANNANISGVITATSGSFTGEVNVTGSGALVVKGTGHTNLVSINKDGIDIKSGSISIGTTFNVSNAGKLTASSVDLTGKISASSGAIGDWFIENGSIVDSRTSPTITLSPNLININNEVVLGKYDGVNYGLKAGASIINSTGIIANSGSIGGIKIEERQIYSNNGFFSLDDNGILKAQGAEITGLIKGTSGQFGEGPGAIKASDQGIWAGLGVGDLGSSFWISSSEMYNPLYPNDDRHKINPGDAFFKGSVSVSSDSFIDNGGNLVINQGSIIAGDRTGANVQMNFYAGNSYGGQIISTDSDGSINFRVDKERTYFKGDITAMYGSILGGLYVGNDQSVHLDGRESGIFLRDNKGLNKDRIVRLNSLGLYISDDGGKIYSPALTSSGLNANAINDGVLTISDSGHGASGILIRQWNDVKNDYVENITIDSGGINVYNGAITVHSEQTGEVLIGGGFLRVKGLDMGVVTSNNFVGNGTFSMISGDYGVMQMNRGEVFLGSAQSSGGAVSNPTYHYAGWPDFGDRDPHTLYTYKINEDGSINNFDPDNLLDINYPNVTRASFNPQWTGRHPIYNYCVVPNDACNFVTVTDKDGNILRQLKAWKGGMFGVDFTPDGSRMITCGDDIDRKRAPWDMVVFDTSSIDVNDWHIIGMIEVGEFPSKVVCDNNGFAYATISLDDTIYKLDLVNMRVDKVYSLRDPRGMRTSPMGMCLNADGSKLYIAAVITDAIYEVPTDTLDRITEIYSVIPYPGNRGIPHDIKLLSNGMLCQSSSSTTDGYVSIIDVVKTYEPSDRNKVGHVMNATVTYIDGLMTDKLALPETYTEKERANWNFFSSTTIVPHPTKKMLYVTVTNRCMISILDYSITTEYPNGDLREIGRVPAGSNPSGISVTTDGTRLFVSNHHFHTYPLGANKIWGYRSSDNFYITDNVFDTGQKYYNANPAGMILTHFDQYLWIANRSTNDISIIDIKAKNGAGYWDDQSQWKTIKEVGNKPYEIKMAPTGNKVYVSNDDSNNKYDPDFITIIDKELAINAPEHAIIGKIYVSDSPKGMEISPDNKYLYVACSTAQVVQQASLATDKIINSIKLDSDVRHLKLHGNKLYVSCFDGGKIAVLNANDLTLIKMMESDRLPSQLETVGDKLYVTNEGSDTVTVYNTITDTFLLRIDTGSQPKPIYYNKKKKVLYVGNAGEGSVCIVDPILDEVIEWCMTGDNPEYIVASEDGEKWFASAHGPEDIISYGKDTPYTGDAYLDNNGKTHKYGSAYWMPSRSDWVRGADNTLTSFSSVEFWPSAQLQGKKGYAQLSVLGMFDSQAKLEQDIYPLTNESDGSCEYTFEILNLEATATREFKEDIADYSDIPGSEKRRVMATAAHDFSVKFIEGVDYEINYEDNTVRRKGDNIPPSKQRQNTESMVGTSPVPLIANGNKYNNIKVYPLNQTKDQYLRGIDFNINEDNNTIERIIVSKTYTLEKIAFERTELRLVDTPVKEGSVTIQSDLEGTMVYTEGRDYEINHDLGLVTIIEIGRIVNNQEVFVSYIRTSAIKDKASVSIQYDYDLNVRYYYHPYKSNYDDVVLSANMFWLWPRPENQYVRMEIDELVPKFIVVDNDQINPWIPTFDLGKKAKEVTAYKGLKYSSSQNRGRSAIMTSSANPLSGNLDVLRDGPGIVSLPGGEQFIKADLGAVFYINEIVIEHPNDGRTINSPKVEISIDEVNWKTVYSKAEESNKYTVYFEKTHSQPLYDSKGLISGYDTEVYNGPERVRYIRTSVNGNNITTTNEWKQIKAMGDWKLNKSYVFASNTLWDSEGKREMYLILNGEEKKRFDKDTLVLDPLQPDTSIADRVKHRIYYINPKGETVHLGSVQLFDIFTGKEYNGIMEGATPNPEKQYDFMYDHLRNTVWKTPNSKIREGEEVRLLFKFVQEDLSNTPLCSRYRDPETGKEVKELGASVAETNVTGAWVEWEFTNSYRCDWYIGWVADIGLGNIDIYIDGKLAHSMSQHSSKVEKYSQLTQDLLPGTHTIKLVQQQGTINFDIIKLEDYQFFHQNSNLVASPSTNPVELFSWHITKLSPGSARKYLGRGAQITSGAYDNPRVDKKTSIPNNQVPIKYRIRFSTTLQGRGEPIPNYGGYGGEASGNEFTFERGSVMITDVIMEKGVNHTYWRMAPSVDKHPGFMIETWDRNEHDKTGIQEAHIADGAITSNKLKAFSVYDQHINNNADIQESKLLLNYATHPHGNKDVLDLINGLGSSGSSNLVARADHTHDELESSTFTGDLTIHGSIKQIGKHTIVHSRPLYGLAGDLQFQIDSPLWERLINHNNLFGYGLPEVAPDATRYYRLYAIYGDNIVDSDSVRPRLKISDDISTVFEWKMPNTWDIANSRRDAFSDYFKASNKDKNHKIELRLQNDTGTYNGSGKEIGIEWLELIAYDVYEE